ncbi:zinc finger protein ZAT12 [Ricinus communis]|uniref:Nucleic acid binding protein, putative n=1 Tax=Ricinus communis TaxID=3988 RepID=B9T4E1_RICCO|nr:zinc finger protein ZAT12 [Ricinus communis]EEF29282.1 nucleic acid binding protein, putative [Ricinus communis]|eukprot:XP_002533110.1 zinc finger protein ZAT12 [Ricinus communis]
MKRDREEAVIDMANCLMLLSKVGQTELEDSKPGRLFACKTCNRRFSSFQALGGHRASHKKPKLIGDDLLKLPSSPPKPKTHECSICGLEFAIGQALGGHMRRHRGNTGGGGGDGVVTRALLPVPVMKKSNSSKRVLCLDLNLTPVENYDLTLQLGKVLF